MGRNVLLKSAADRAYRALVNSIVQGATVGSKAVPDGETKKILEGAGISLEQFDKDLQQARAKFANRIVE